MKTQVAQYRKDLISTIIDKFKEDGKTWAETRKFLRENYSEIKATSIKSVRGMNNFNKLVNQFDNVIVITQAIKQNGKTTKYVIGHCPTDGMNAKTSQESVVVNCKKGTEVNRVAKEVAKIGGESNIIFGFDSSKLRGITGIDLNRVAGESHCKIDLFELGHLTEIHRQCRMRYSQTAFFGGDDLRNVALFDLCYSFIYYNESFEDYC